MGTAASAREAMESTVAEQKSTNIHVEDGISEADYVKLRTGRDKTLPLPDRMLHALQVNLRGGRLPEAESNGVSRSTGSDYFAGKIMQVVDACA